MASVNGKSDVPRLCWLHVDVSFWLGRTSYSSTPIDALIQHHSKTTSVRRQSLESSTHSSLHHLRIFQGVASIVASASARCIRSVHSTDIFSALPIFPASRSVTTVSTRNIEIFQLTRLQDGFRRKLHGGRSRACSMSA